MKPSLPLALVAGVLAACAAASGAAAATVTPPAAVAAPGLVVQPVATDAGDQLDSKIDGNLVSYTDFSGATPAIHYYDLTTGVDATIPNGGAYDVASDVFGGSIVYTHVDGACQDVTTFATSTAGPPIPIDATPCPVLRTDASVGGDTIAWEDYGVNDPNSRIVVRDRSSGAETTLTAADAFSTNPGVSPDGGTVAWTTCSSPGTGCHVWDATRNPNGTWTTRQLTNDAGDDGLAATNGTVVAYDCTRGGAADICWQPVGGGAETELAFTGFGPHVSGRLITFEHRDATGQSDVYAYDLATGILYRLTSDANDEVLSDVWTDPATGVAHVTWSTQQPTGGYDVYAASFAPIPPDAALTITKVGAVADRRGDAAAAITFTDADPNGNLSQYSGTIDWGDATVPTPLLVTTNPLGGFVGGGVHRYAATGSYTVTVTVRDSGGASATQATTLVIASRS